MKPDKKTIIVFALIIFAIIYHNFDTFNTAYSATDTAGFATDTAYSATDITGLATLRIGEVAEVEGKTAEVTGIGSDYVKIKIGDEKCFIRLNEEKKISSINIRVNKIFFVEEPEGRFAEITLSSSIVCGNKVCEETETKENCCFDCGCDTGFECIDSRCKSPIDLDKCNSAKDCNDGNSETTDLCTGKPKKCYNKIILQCEKNEDCDDGKAGTKDKCVKNECFNTKTSSVAGDGAGANAGAESNEKTVKSGNDTVSERSITIKKEKSFFAKLIDILFGWI